MDILKNWWRRPWRLIFDLVVVVVVVFAVEKWQSRTLLPADGTVQAPTLQGKTLAGGDYQLAAPTHKKRLLYFFAPWCSACRLTSANVSSFAEKYADSYEVVAVALVWEKTSEVAAFVEEHKLAVPVVLGDEAIMNAYKITAFPTLYFVDEKGFIAGRTVGYTTMPGLALRQW